MKHCTIGSCTRYPTMGEQCVTHWYEIQGKPMPAMVPLTPGGWVDTWRRGAAAKQAANPVLRAAVEHDDFELWEESLEGWGLKPL